MNRVSASLVACVVAAPSFAQAINIDIGTVHVPPSSYGAAGRIGAWNKLPATASAFPLVDVGGAATGATITCSPPGVNIDFGWSQPVSPGMAMLHDAHDLGFYSPGPGPLYRWTIDGLANGWYRVIVYSTSTSGVIGGTTEITVVGGLHGAQTCAEPYPSYEPLKHGVSFAMDVVQVTSGSLAWTARTLSSTGKCNSAQIEPIVPGDVHAYCLALANSQGCVPAIFATGSASLAANSLRVKAVNVINNKVGVVFWSRAPGAFYSGALGGYSCVTPPVVRTPAQISDGNPPPDDCSGAYSFHVSAPYAASAGISAGDTLYFQYWQRDPAAPNSHRSLSDGLSISFAP